MKYEELQLLAEESELDIVAITESWAKGRGICIGVCYRSPSAGDKENECD